MSTAQHCLDGLRGDTAHQTPEAAVTEWLRNSKADVNITQPACQLPNELLVHIFTIYAQISSYNNTAIGGYSWMKLLMVCKHWYNVACATPKLWQNIKVKSFNMEWVSLCLTRSAAAQIDVILCSGWTHPEIYFALASHIHRIRELHLVGVSSYWSSQLPALLRPGAPSLETLQIIHSATFPASENPKFIGPNFTPEHFPRLHNLYLTSSQAPNDAAIYSNLCELVLNACTYAGTFQSFIMNIRSAHRLTYILLDDFLSQFPLNDVFLSIPPIRSNPLLRLTKLIVWNDSVKHISGFLSHLNFTTERLALWGRYPRSGENEVSHPLFELLPVTGLDDSCVPSLERAKTVELEAYTSFKVSIGEGNGPSDLVELHCDARHWEPTLESGLYTLSRILRPVGSRLVRLSVNSQQDLVDWNDWACAFRTLPALEEIVIDGFGSSDAFWLGLEEASRESETTGVEDRIPPTCPRLRSVVYCQKSGLDEVTFEAMVECLEYRETRGAAALEELEMVYHGMRMPSGTEAEFVMLTEKYVPRLRELVNGTVSLN